MAKSSSTQAHPPQLNEGNVVLRLENKILRQRVVALDNYVENLEQEKILLKTALTEMYELHFSCIELSE